MPFCPNCNNSFAIIRRQDIKVEENAPDAAKTSEVKPIKLGTHVKAYYKCVNCGFVTEIQPRELILSKAPEKATSEFYEYTKYAGMVNDVTLPCSRNYVCPNDNCPSHKDHSKREKVWFRPSRNSCGIKNICRACHVVW